MSELDLTREEYLEASEEIYQKIQLYSQYHGIFNFSENTKEDILELLDI